MRLPGIVFLVLLGTGMTADAAEKRLMQIEDLFHFKRISEAQSSPNGAYIVYPVTEVSLDGNKSTTSLWWVNIATEKPTPRRLTNPNGKSDRHPRWSPDGTKILFESTRSGSSQLWIIEPFAGGEATQLTTISTGASTGIWSPDGKHIAFVSAVFPENSELPFKESDAANKKRIDDAEANPVKAKVFKKLFFRHWDEYVEDKRQHLFVIPATGGEPKDVTPGDRDAYPTSTTFSIGDDYTFSPDSSHLVFTAVPSRDEAWSTNYDICRVPIKGGTKEWETLTPDNEAADSAPKFSPDGKHVAWRAQKKAGYEADKWEITVATCNATGKLTGKPQSLTDKIDRSADEFLWQNNGQIVFLAEEDGGTPLFGVNIADKTITKNPQLGTRDATQTRDESPQGTTASLSVGKDGKLVYIRSFLNAPAEVFTQVFDPEDFRPRKPLSEKFVNVSNANTKFLDELDLPRPESVTVKGDGDTPMQMWILKPPGFDPKKKWPVAYLVHGGPQGAWNDGWSYRWNPEIWAAQGYVVALPNPRGSTGFGQQYVDQISGDWGGKCYRDLMKGVEYLEALPYVDKDRMGSAGASFGGYMMNWFAVNTDKFKCLITHCGVYNFESMYALTEELWFDEYEHGGPPWASKGNSYKEHSPHRLAANLAKYKTPMLVVHNDLDFRVAVAEGLQLFTTLQRQGVKSRMVNFPDEGHWVLKPKNSQFWHQEVFKWLTEHVPPGGK